MVVGGLRREGEYAWRERREGWEGGRMGILMKGCKQGHTSTALVRLRMGQERMDHAKSVGWWCDEEEIMEAAEAGEGRLRSCFFSPGHCIALM